MSRLGWRAGAAVIVSLMSLALAACGGGGSSNSGNDTGIGLTPVTCSTFTYQREAQLYYQANKASSAAALDPDGNGLACESLPTDSTTVPVKPADTPAVVPSGIWVGTMSNGDIVRGVVFPPPTDNPALALTAETWFLRMRASSYGTVLPVWVTYGGTGTAAVNGVFGVKDAQVLRVTDFGASQSTVIDWTSKVTPAVSTLGFDTMVASWPQSGEQLTFTAYRQTSLLPIPSIASMAGTYADVRLAATATTTAATAALPTLTIAGDGKLQGQITGGCTFTGLMYLTNPTDPAYHLNLYVDAAGKASCPRQIVGGAGIGLIDKVSGQFYMIAQDNAGAALLFAGMKQ
ncbi:hypothetical protein BH10PSE18_BH10PSE18_20850 [soil metagenome]